MAKVLFIEDDPSWQGILKELLETAGHETQRSTTFDAAIGILSGKKKFDVIVFDLRLGTKALGDDPFLWLSALIDGLTARKIRIPPIIIVTGVAITNRQIVRALTQYRGVVANLFEKIDFDHNEFMKSIKEAQNHFSVNPTKPRSFFQLIVFSLLMAAIVISTFAVLLWSVGQVPNPQTQQAILQTGGALLVVIFILVIVFSQNAKIEDVIEAITKIWRG